MSHDLPCLLIEMRGARNRAIGTRASRVRGQYGYGPAITATTTILLHLVPLYYDDQLFATPNTTRSSRSRFRAPRVPQRFASPNSARSKCSRIRLARAPTACESGLLTLQPFAGPRSARFNCSRIRNVAFQLFAIPKKHVPIVHESD